MYGFGLTPFRDEFAIAARESFICTMRDVLEQYKYTTIRTAKCKGCVNKSNNFHLAHIVHTNFASVQTSTVNMTRVLP